MESRILIRVNRELKSEESENSDQVIQILTNNDELYKKYKLVMHKSWKRKNGNENAFIKT